MPLKEEIIAFQDEITAWRRDIHAHPETAFEETRTSAFVAEKLETFGLPVHRGLAKTGVVGTLKVGDSNRAIGLRADLDALDIMEENTFAHASTHPGKMHACGHDGHTAMLLAAARYLSETRRFNGTVQFIFQPAEENVAGGRVMVEEGLFDLFPVEAVYGMHNQPGLPLGTFGVRTGSAMASADMFEITITGKGSHAAHPHQGVDPVVTAAEIILAFQRIAARSVNPIESAVVSVTQIEGGTTTNIIPEAVTLRGTCRALKPDVQDLIQARMEEVVNGITAAHGLRYDFEYDRRYPVLINTREETLGPGGRRRGGGRERRHQPAARDGIGGFRLDAAGPSRLLHPGRQRRGRGWRLHRPQPQLRFQRRGGDLWRQLLGEPGRAGAFARLGG